MRLGIMGFGAFGELMAIHLVKYFDVFAHDPRPERQEAIAATGAVAGRTAEIGDCDIVVLATPMRDLRDAICQLRPFLRPKTLVLDVTSVKMAPARLMLDELPETVDILCTHPLFGPQSARNGIAGLHIALCPLRGGRVDCVADFLKKKLGLEVAIVTPEEHDRELAVVQGLTHLIARILIRIDAKPSPLSTVSYDLLLDAVEMVRHDSEGVFMAIERDNPFAAAVRGEFFKIADDVRRGVEAEVTDLRPA
jgi:prephenate dehydrogenase